MPARILIIEDNPASLELMTYILRAFGYETLSAADGEAGLEIARRGLPDLIVCDIGLPKMDGYEVAARLKDHLTLRNTPLVAVTALAMVGDRERVISAGFDGYITKPIVPETFVAQVSAFLQPHLRSTSQLEPSPTTTHEPVVSTPKRATILVVDDSYTNRDLIYNTLEPSGYNVVTAKSMQDGLRLARQSLPDLILSDIHMPDESGWDFIKAVKADPQLSSIPFLFITSSVWIGKERATALALGATRFIVRPIEAQALIDEIESCLREIKGK